MFLFIVFFPGKPEKVAVSESPDKDPGADGCIRVGSTVEVHLAGGPAYATVRWIGSLPNMQNRMAGLELVLINTDLFW